MEIAAGALFFVQLDHFARGAGFCAESVPLFVGTVDPDNLVGLAEGDVFFDPPEDALVCGHVGHDNASFRSDV